MTVLSKPSKHLLMSNGGSILVKMIASSGQTPYIAPDKAVYCVFTQLLGPSNAIKFISVRTKTQ